jgi:uncharacterized protein associated with vWA-MoxR-VMAP ternary system
MVPQGLIPHLNGDSDITVDLIPAAQLRCLSDSKKRLVSRMSSGYKDIFGRPINTILWPTVPETGFDDNKTSLVLIPLDRIGAEQGFSGSKVLLGYFRDNSKTPPSLSMPVIVKITDPDKKVGEEDKLRLEYNNFNSISSFFKNHNLSSVRDRFALPLPPHEDDYQNELNPCTLLWAPFHGIIEKEGERLVIQHENSFQHLLLRSDKKACSIIQQTYDILGHLHSNAVKKQKNIVDEYNWYLRGIDSEDDEIGNLFKKMWGSKEDVDFLDQTWKNPFLVLNKLRSRPGDSSLYGPIHGDLHPRNILVSGNQTSIIDFGWAGSDRHIMKDYVLLESNLRFMTLDFTVPHIEIKAINEYLSNIHYPSTQFKIPPEISHPHARYTMDCIFELRRSVIKAFKQCEKTVNWKVDYNIPLFLVSFGLLKKLKHANNQVSALLNVLSLATSIDKSSQL